jgi:DNA-binding transcriptional ArsR family regulator
MSINPNIDDSVEAAGVFRTLSDPFRLHIFTSIAGASRARSENGHVEPLEMSSLVDEIAVGMNMAPDLVEQHILELSRAKLVVVDEEIDGQLILVVNTDLVKRVRRIASGEDGGYIPDE